MWRLWDGRQTDPKLSRWWAGGETLDRGMCGQQFDLSIWT